MVQSCEHTKDPGPCPCLYFQGFSWYILNKKLKKEEQKIKNISLFLVQSLPPVVLLQLLLLGGVERNWFSFLVLHRGIQNKFLYS